MNQDFFGPFSDVRQASFESLRELTAINARAIQRLTEIQLALANLSIDSTVRQARLLTDSAGYGDLMAAESRLASDCGGRLLELSGEAAGIMAESRDAFLAWARHSLDAPRREEVKKQPAKPTAKSASRRNANRKAA